MEGNEVGTPLSRLQLDPGSLSAVLEAAKEGGGGSVRLNSVPPGAVEVCTAAAYLCIKCRLTFAKESSISSHGCGLAPGQVTLVRARAACKQCDAVLDNAHDFKRHTEMSHSEPPLSPRLSVEMENVVNQITALAAQSLKPSDPNANIFDKFAVPSAGQ